ncbi:L-carnitine dehydratase/bile acid-inducible protein F [Halorubrum sp. AJ67]|nr:L-carnitine dehydratase/bile acid-inducible protein F [Halorubrum sp. AJ67]
MPASRVRDVSEVFADPQIEARGMLAEADHPTAGTVTFPGSPMYFSRTPTTVRRHPPALGEHTESVLREYGYGDGDIDELRERGAISE